MPRVEGESRHSRQPYLSYMPKEKLNSEQETAENIERRHFDAPSEQEVLKEDSEDMLANAMAMLEAEVGSLEYEKNGNRILSVIVKNAENEVIFSSREPKDIEVFLKFEIPKKLES